MQKKNNKTKLSIIIQIQENWKWITILLACCSMGFFMGKTFAGIMFDVKIKELEIQNQLQIIELKEKNLELRGKYVNEVIDLKNEVKRLQEKIKSYENENTRAK